MVERPATLWRHPCPERTEMWRFMKDVVDKRGLRLETYNDLHQYSVNRRLDFWADIWDWAGIISEGSYKTVVDTTARIDSLPKWFEGVRLNYAENILYSRSPGSRSTRSARHKEDDKVALVEVREGQLTGRPFTWGELRDRTALFANALRAHGVKEGDRVAVVASNSIDILCVFLGTAVLGALFSSNSSDMGSKAILERLRQIQPKWVFVDDSAVYNGKGFVLKDKMKDIVAGMKDATEFEGLISVPRDRGHAHDVSSIPKTVTLENFLNASDSPSPSLEFNRISFSSGLAIVYSSGTTGQPKCIVHSVGGLLISNWKEGSLHRGFTPSSCGLQYTNLSWIMYYAAIQILLFGSRFILYDGSPFIPNTDSFLRLAGEQGVTHLGVSPRYFSTIQAAGIVPRKIPGLEKLQLTTSTGMVLPTSFFRWFYSDVGFPSHVHLANISGGTDIAGAFTDGNPLDPIYESGGCQCASLGMDVKVFDSTMESMDGEPIVGKEVAVGKPGDLVCVKSFPNMPIKFWGDEGGKKYRGAYFERFDNVWTHGDFIQQGPSTNAIIFLGRADGVLNPSGVRFGSAEIYSIIENSFKDEIEDSICIGQRRKGDIDETVLLFTKLRPKASLTPVLIQRIKAAIAEGLSRRHVPKYIFETPEIPTTINGKKVELPVKRIVSGERVIPSGTLANPGCLEYYYGFVRSEEVAARGKSKI